jgi:hypothetical protein
MPPCREMAMANRERESVTVSMAAATIGMFSEILRERQVRVSACAGSTDDLPGSSSTSSNVLGNYSWGAGGMLRSNRLSRSDRMVCPHSVRVWREFRPELDRKPSIRAALLDRIAHGDPDKVTPDKTARHQQSALAALRIIHAKQANYLAAHPGDGYACQLYLLGVDPSRESELGTLLAGSDYDVKILRCSQVDGPNYVVLAIPRTEGNPGDAPIYCLDQANGIERYDADQARDAVPAVVTRVTQPCPQTGTHIE